MISVYKYTQFSNMLVLYFLYKNNFLLSLLIRGLAILPNIWVQQKLSSPSRFRVEIILVNAGPK